MNKAKVYHTHYLHLFVNKWMIITAICIWWYTNMTSWVLYFKNWYIIKDVYSKFVSTWEIHMRNIWQLIFCFLSQTGYRFIGQSVTDVKKLKRCTVYISLPKQFYIVQQYLPSRLRFGGELPSTVFGLRAAKAKNPM